MPRQHYNFAIGNLDASDIIFWCGALGEDFAASADPPVPPDDIPYDRRVDAAPGEVRQLTPLVRRVIAPNGGPFTFTGTCTYIVGLGRVAVVDPGPVNAAHHAALLAALAGETVAHILTTHTHRDHSPGARALQAATGAPVIGCAPHFAARELAAGETSFLDASNDRDYAPDRVLADGESLQGDTYTLAALATPGHTMNHLCFALKEENALFSGDHVMAWSTSIVAPPDGAMGAYMASLEKLRGRPEAVYWPGHGGPVNEPQRFVRALAHHRRQREVSILNCLAGGPRAIPQIVERIYENLDARLKRAAALSVFAHLEDLCARGLVTTQGAVTPGARYAAV